METAERTSPEVDEVASGLSESVPPPGMPNTVDKLPPSSLVPEVLDEPAAEAVDETDLGSRKASSRADGEGDGPYLDPSATVVSRPERVSQRRGPASGSRKVPYR